VFLFSRVVRLEDTQALAMESAVGAPGVRRERRILEDFKMRVRLLASLKRISDTLGRRDNGMEDTYLGSWSGVERRFLSG